MLPCTIEKSAFLVPQNLRVRAERLVDALEQNPLDIAAKVSLFFLSTCHLYSEISLPLGVLSQGIYVTITSHVLGDGLGDYYHALAASELIHKKFPAIKVSMIAFFEDKNAILKVRMPEHGIKTVFQADYEFSDKAADLLEIADQIIEISQSNLDNPAYARFVKAKESKYTFIGEYGYEEELAMGLGINNMGIFIKDKPTIQSILNINHRGLKEFLFKTQTPSNADLELYRNNHALFIGYLKNGSYYQTGFIYTLAAYLKFSPEKTIDILIPSVSMDILDKEFLREQGIGKVTSIALGKGIQIEEVLLDPMGKELRLIDPFPLDQQDLHALFFDTDILVGCAGDQSFTEVVSFDRLPFFENHQWKDLFYQDLIELAGTVGEDPHYLQQYFAELHSMYDEDQENDISLFKAGELNQGFLQKVQSKQAKIGAASIKIAELMRQKGLYQEINAFNQLLRENYSFAPVLYDLVKRQLVFNSYPEIRRKEKEVKEAYYLDSMSLTESIEQIIQVIEAQSPLD